MERHQQQQRQLVHRSIRIGIARLSNPVHEKDRHILIVDTDLYRANVHDYYWVDRYSWQHLVHFLNNVDDSHQVVIRELKLLNVRLRVASDGGLQVLIDFFSSNETSLTTVSFCDCILAANKTSRGCWQPWNRTQPWCAWAFVNSHGQKHRRL
jgi:hypothetical protein